MFYLFLAKWGVAPPSKSHDLQKKGYVIRDQENTLRFAKKMYQIEKLKLLFEIEIAIAIDFCH